MAIKVLVDSGSDISVKEGKEMGIEVIPMLITIDGVDYYDGENLTPNEFYEKLIETDGLPKTTQVNPYRFEEYFHRLTENGDTLLVITLSSKLSGTYMSAVTASSYFENKVYVVDSLNAAVGERLLVQYALRLINQGLDIVEIVNELNEKKKKINLIALVDTLEYLKKGGRISSATAFAGELLSIKPVVSVIDGEVKLVGKARGSKRANNLLTELILARGGIDFSMPYGTVYSGFESTTLDKYLKDSEYLYSQYVSYVPKYILGGTIGTHIGPGAAGVAFFSK